MDEAVEELEQLLLESKLLTDNQAEVYIQRTKRGLTREEVGEIRDVGKRTSDQQLSQARKRMRSVFDLMLLFKQYELIPVRRSNDKVWHRVDRLSCKHVYLIEVGWPNEEGLEFRSDIPDLPGELCEDCFPEL